MAKKGKAKARKWAGKRSVKQVGLGVHNYHGVAQQIARSIVNPA